MMKRVNVYLDEDSWYEFRKRCLDQREAASNVLNQFIKRFIKQPVATKEKPCQSDSNTSA